MDIPTKIFPERMPTSSKHVMLDLALRTLEALKTNMAQGGSNFTNSTNKKRKHSREKWQWKRKNLKLKWSLRNTSTKQNFSENVSYIIVHYLISLQFVKKTLYLTFFCDILELRLREADCERRKREWEIKERQAEEQRTREDELRRRQQEEMALRIRRQEEELHRRQQENNLFMQVSFHKYYF